MSFVRLNKDGERQGGREEGEKCVRLRLIDEAGRKRKKKAAVVKIERVGNTRGYIHDSVRT